MVYEEVLQDQRSSIGLHPLPHKFQLSRGVFFRYHLNPLSLMLVYMIFTSVVRRKTAAPCHIPRASSIAAEPVRDDTLERNVLQLFGVGELALGRGASPVLDALNCPSIASTTLYCVRIVIPPIV